MARENFLWPSSQPNYWKLAIHIIQSFCLGPTKARKASISLESDLTLETMAWQCIINFFFFFLNQLRQRSNAKVMSCIRNNKRNSASVTKTKGLVDKRWETNNACLQVFHERTARHLDHNATEYNFAKLNTWPFCTHHPWNQVKELIWVYT